ncbi:LOW QUALITY PROTEIN: hypothetical protein QTO34_007980 [Cnephaeus nilssonii]|uniref:Uncharacterized protein n=1 Tax=Cnephaeus nilssonii TaxID=3371016 RepID=A0AA40IAI6_CNENI|nr:LOW QUALITY PROTEIN: hypothetical protein QTO34_007980 [Eptesicus nilssonii]
MKNKMNVIWRANIKAWITRQFLIEWIHEVFVPKIPSGTINATQGTSYHGQGSCPPPGLEAELVQEWCHHCEVLPPNTTPLIQPMDQQHAEKCIPGPCNQPGGNCGLSLLPKETLRALRMSCCGGYRVSGPVHGLEVDDDDDDDDVEELVEDHNTKLTTKKLQDLQREQQQVEAEKYLQRRR